MLFYPKNEVMAFPKIKIKWDWVSDVHVYIKSNAVIWFWRYCHVRTRQTSENQITDRKCVVQTNSRGKMELVLQRNEWVKLFGCRTLQCYVFMLSTRFVRTSGNGLSHKTWSHFLFAQHLEALWWTCLRYDIFFLMLETEELISKIGSHHILQEASELWSCN